MITNSFLTDQPNDFITLDQFKNFSDQTKEAYKDYLKEYLNDCTFAGNAAEAAKTRSFLSQLS